MIALRIMLRHSAINLLLEDIHHSFSLAATNIINSRDKDPLKDSKHLLSKVDTKNWMMMSQHLFQRDLKDGKKLNKIH